MATASKGLHGPSSLEQALGGSGAKRPRTWWRYVWLVTSKDMAIEATTREITTTSSFFALLVTITASVALQGGSHDAMLVAPGVLWIAVLFAAFLAIGKTWARERENDALAGLLSSPMPSSALLAGKALGLLLFLAVVEAVVVPLTVVLFSVELGRCWAELLIVSVLTLPGIAVTGCLFGAMTVRTQARDLILATVLLPLLLPVVLAAVAATREAFSGAELGELGDYLLLLFVFDFLFSMGSFGLFKNLVRE